MKYNKITKGDILDVLSAFEVDIVSVTNGLANVETIANILGTSKYQVRRYIRELKEENLVYIDYTNIYHEEEVVPPYWGYRLTREGMGTDNYIKIASKYSEDFDVFIGKCLSIQG